MLCSATPTAGLFLTPQLPAAEESCREQHLKKNTRDSQKRKEEAARERQCPGSLFVSPPRADGALIVRSTRLSCLDNHLIVFAR